MTELPDVVPLRPSGLTRKDLTAVLTGLAPGDYLSRDLLPRVNAWLVSEGRAPVTAKTLGECLNRVMGLERKRVRGNVRTFRVTPEAVAGRDWFKP